VIALAALVASVACAATPVHGESLPQSGSLAGVKWVQATPHKAGIVGMLFAYDAKISGDPPRFSLWAGGKEPAPGQRNQKILWIVRNPHSAPSIVVRGFEIGGMDGFKESFNEVGQIGRGISGREYASIVTVPHAGCWRLDVTTGRAKGSFVVQVVEP